MYYTIDVKHQSSSVADSAYLSGDVSELLEESAMSGDHDEPHDCSVGVARHVKHNSQHVTGEILCILCKVISYS